MNEFNTLNFKLEDGEYWENDWDSPFDFVNKTIGDYLVLKKVKYLSFKSSRFEGLKYYICKNTKTGLFSLQKNTTIERIYRESSTLSYLGVKYTEEDKPFYMTVDSFIAGFDKFRLRDGTLSSWWLERIPLAKKCYFNNISFFETLVFSLFI